MKLVEPLDLTIYQKTLDKGIIDAANAVKWNTSRVHDKFKQANPYTVIKLGNILVTSIILFFKKNNSAGYFQIRHFAFMLFYYVCQLYALLVLL
jgi:hypothetical protein